MKFSSQVILFGHLEEHYSVKKIEIERGMGNFQCQESYNVLPTLIHTEYELAVWFYSPFLLLHRFFSGFGSLEKENHSSRQISNSKN